MEVLIVLILNKTHDVDFVSPWIDIYKNRKVRIRTLQYLVEGCVFDFDSPWSDTYKKRKVRIRTVQYSVECCVCCLACSLCLFITSFIVNTATNKTEMIMMMISIFLNLWIWMNTCIHQTYFECYKFDVNFVLILIATCTYKSILNWVRMNQSSWNSILLMFNVDFEWQIFWETFIYSQNFC